VVGGERHGHHTVIREVEEREEHDPSVPEELDSSPLKGYHGECYQRVRYRLDETVWYLNQDLHIIHARAQLRLSRRYTYMPMERVIIDHAWV
jgi:hypothetical protein